MIEKDDHKNERTIIFKINNLKHIYNRAKNIKNNSVKRLEQSKHIGHVFAITISMIYLSMREFFTIQVK